MTLEEKIKKLKSLDYPVEEFTQDEIERHYARVIGMNITTSILHMGNHPHAKEIPKGMIDIEMIED